jgi:hypothetical protein
MKYSRILFLSLIVVLVLGMFFLVGSGLAYLQGAFTIFLPLVLNGDSGSTEITPTPTLSFTPTPNPLRWRQITPQGTSPPARAIHTAIYDVANHRMIIFGGLVPTNPSRHGNDVWSLDLALGMEQWTELNPTGSAPPTGRRRTAIYDEVNQRMIVFGGDDCLLEWWGDVMCGPTDKAWELDLTPGNESWEEIETGPGDRLSHSAIYDAGNQRMIVFGGKKVTYFNPPSNDVWAFDLTEGSERWFQLLPPSPRLSGVWGHAVIYSPENRWMLTFGGFTDVPGIDTVDQTWVLDISSPDDESWIDIGLSSQGPDARGDHSLAYDTRYQRTLLFGGVRGRATYNDVWFLDFQEETFYWQELSLSSPIPKERWGHTAIYDPISHRMIIFGGQTGPVDQPNFVNETWSLDLP